MSTAQPSLLAASEGQKFFIGNWEITSRVLGSQNSNTFELYELLLGPGSVDYHVHNTSDETITVLEGSIEFMVDGKKFLHQPGSTAFIPRGLHHGFTNVGAGKARVLLLFSPASRQNEFFGKVEALFQNAKPDLQELARLQKEYDQELVPFPG